MFTDTSKEEINSLDNSFNNSKINDNLYTEFLSSNQDFTAKLPPEILLYIFKFVSRRDLQLYAGLVNKRWHQLARDPTLLRVLKLSKKTPQLVIKEYIEQRPLLKILKASGLENINETIETIITKCSFLVCLDIGFCPLIYDTIFSICQHGKNLKHINLEGASVDHMMIEQLCINLPQLEVLNLSHCSKLTDQTMYCISEELIVVKAINIDGIQNISDYGIVYIVNKHFPHLTAIWIDGCELTDIGLQSLTMCHCLSFLSISYADTLTDVSVDPLRSLRYLESLIVHKATQLSKQALLNLFHREDSQLTQLTNLDLNECSVIDDEVLGCILDLCGSHLQILSLQWCWNITDDGISNLVAVASNIQRLSLIGNHIIKGTSFRLIPERWLYLRLLNLTNCNQIDDDLLKSIARQMPSTYIFDYFGERFGDNDDNVTQYDIARAMEKMSICEHLKLGCI